MSVASEIAPEVYIPAGARRRSLRAVPGDASAIDRAYLLAPSYHPDVNGPAAPAAAALGAEVVDLDRWRHQFVGAQAGERRRNAAGLRTRPGASAPVQLTRRGVVVVAAASMLLALGVLAVAWLSAPAGVGSSSGVAGPGAAVVTVQAGDSLWTIATRVAPNRDPRAEIEALSKLNHLSGDAITPGQQLRVH